MKKVLIVYDSLQIGGIATYLINLLKQIDYCAVAVTLLVKDIDDDVKSQLPAEIKLDFLTQKSKLDKAVYYFTHGAGCAMFRLFVTGKRKATWGRDSQQIQYLNACLSPRYEGDFDVAIGADMFWADYYVLTKTHAAKKYVWIHPEYNALHTNHGFDEKLFSVADGIIAVSQRNAEALKNTFPALKEKIDFIDNFIDADRIRTLAAQRVNTVFAEDKLNIITVCRLDTVSKRLDRLVHCAALLAENNVSFVWRLIGEGPDVAYVRQLIANAGLQDKVLLLGKQCNPYPYVNQSDVFVLLSLFEGVPLAVTEAMILGVPVVVSNYESASMQVGEAFGIIVKNEDATVAQQAASALQKKKKLTEENRVFYYADNSLSRYKLDVMLGISE